MEMRLLIYLALSSFHVGDFDKYLDDVTISNINPVDDVSKHTEVFEQLDLKNERKRLIQSILKIREECNPWKCYPLLISERSLLQTCEVYLNKNLLEFILHLFTHRL